MKGRLLLVLLACVLIVSGCGKGNPTVKAGKNNSGSAASESDSGKTGASPMSTDEKNSNSDEEVSENKTDVSENNPAGAKMVNMSAEAVNYRHNLICEMGGPVITPEDFEIGPLMVYSDLATINGAANPEKEYFMFIDRFFSQLASGSVPSGMIDSGSLFFLKQIFQSYIEKEQLPDYVRIGKPVPAQDKIRFNLRMFKGNNRTEGEIVLSGTGSSLKVKEFYGDLSLLDIDYVPAGEKYEPEVYRFQ